MFKNLTAISACTLIALAAGPAFASPPSDLIDAIVSGFESLQAEIDELGNLGGAKTIFVTSTPTSSGDLGGLAGADRFCQDLADASDSIVPEGEYVALLSTDDVNASSRITPSSGTIIRPDGTIVAVNAATLFYTGIDDAVPPPETLITPPNMDELGNELAVSVWTGTDERGLTALNNTCDNWDDNDVLVGAADGRSDRINSDWIIFGPIPCNVSDHHLYCIKR